MDIVYAGVGRGKMHSGHGKKGGRIESQIRIRAKVGAITRKRGEVVAEGKVASMSGDRQRGETKQIAKSHGERRKKKGKFRGSP